MTPATPLRPLSQGRRLHSARIGPLRFVETRHPAGLTLPAHVHARPSVTVVLAGHFEERFGRTAYECGPLAVLLKPSDAVHANRYGRQGARSLLIELDRDMERRLAPFARFEALRARVQGGIAAAQGLRLLTMVRARDPAVEPLVEELTLELVGTTAEELDYHAGRRAPPWLRRVRDALHDRCAEPLTLTALAAEAGVHPVSLARAFRRCYGRPLGHYLRRLRASRAADRLTASRAPAAAVAAATGFCDQSHLNRVFRRETGWAPGHYRRAARRLGDDP